MDIIIALNSLFCDIMDKENIIFSRDQIIDQIENWDSLSQITLISLCESEFNIKFSLDDIINIHSIGDLIDLIKNKLK
jgi:acyl carrier protein